MRSEAALLLLLLDSESELLRGRLQSLRYTRKLFFTGWFPLLKPLAGKSWREEGGTGQEGVDQRQYGARGTQSSGHVLLLGRTIPIYVAAAGSGQSLSQQASAPPCPWLLWQLLASGHRQLKGQQIPEKMRGEVK